MNSIKHSRLLTLVLALLLVGAAWALSVILDVSVLRVAAHLAFMGATAGICGLVVIALIRNLQVDARAMAILLSLQLFGLVLALDGEESLLFPQLAILLLAGFVSLAGFVVSIMKRE